MKSVLSAFILFALILSFGASYSVAQNIDTVITGKVTDANGDGVDGANVTVNCEGNFRNVTTTSSGDYLVIYPRTECTQGDSATATATSPDGTGSNNGTVERFTYGPGLELDIAIINISVPEFGMVTGVMTALGSGIAYLGLKRKLSV